MKNQLQYILLTFIISLSAMGESSQSYSYLQKGGDVSVNAYGRMAAPSYIYLSLEAGQLNPFLQLALQQHLMNKCVEKVLDSRPEKKTPFTTAHGAFANGLCRISKCFQQMMILDFLAQSSSNSKANGGKTDKQSQSTSQEIALTLYQASAKSGCDAKVEPTSGSASDNADSNLLKVLQ